jgi:hypothetical protein
MKVLILMTSLFAFSAVADTEITLSDELSLADEAIESPQMNIEGQYQIETPPAPVAAPAPKQVVRRAAPKRVSASDRLKLYRERLELRNRIMVEKKMEQIRYQQELALARQLERSMNQTLNAIDKVN